MFLNSTKMKTPTQICGYRTWKTTAILYQVSDGYSGLYGNTRHVDRRVHDCLPGILKAMRFTCNGMNAVLWYNRDADVLPASVT